ncbi:MAG: hypothetical protein WCA46_01895 [Actinocatenispora sp.]
MVQGIDQQTKALSVNFDNLDGLQTYIDTITRWMDDVLIGELLDGTRGLRGVNLSAAYGENFDEADILAKYANGAKTQMGSQLRDLRKRVESLSTSMAKVQKAYRTIEDKNHADVKKINAMLAPPGSGSTASDRSASPAADADSPPPVV